jgi:zinc transport system permease protein
MFGAMALSVATAVTGAVGSFYLDVPSGASIVVLSVLLFVVVTLGAALFKRVRRRREIGPRATPRLAAVAPEPAEVSSS